MMKGSRIIALFWGCAVLLMGTGSVAATLSHEEVEALWEGLLKKEEYRSIEYLNRKYEAPTTDKKLDEPKIIVIEGREAYLWGFFGMSEGGGWAIKGQLEAETSVPEGLLQLYSKASTYWWPGFILIEPWYDLDKYPKWEFRLILRNPVRRQEIQTLKAIPVPPKEVIRGLPGAKGIPPPGEELCPLGQRCPRGELH